MPQHEAAYIGNRFGRAQTSRRERHPGLRTAGRHERITRPHMDERILIHAQVNERVTAEDVLRLADRFFANGSLAVTVLGDVNGLQVTKEQLAL